MGGVNIEFKKIAIEYSEDIQFFLEKYSAENSKIAFANLYAFDYIHKASFMITNDSLFIISEKSGGTTFYQPVCSKEAIKKNVEIMVEHCKEQSIPLIIEECDNNFIEQLQKNGFKFNRIERRDQWEYIYSVDALKTLNGKSLHKKKNRVNKFTREHPDYSIKELKFDDKEEILEFHRYWCYLKNLHDDPVFEFERQAITKLFDVMNHISVIGVIILDKGLVKGFSIGTRLRVNTLVIMIEKADLQLEYEGIYACLNTEMARFLNSEYKFINRQQDMGIGGLRKTKLSWKPEKLLICDTVIFNN